MMRILTMTCDAERADTSKCLYQQVFNADSTVEALTHAIQSAGWCKDGGLDLCPTCGANVTADLEP